MSMDILAFAMPGGIEWIVVLLMTAVFPGALGLLIFVPVANVILLFYLAFAQWPALRSQDQN